MSLKLLTRILLLGTIGVLLFHLLFFWTNYIIDSYFYWAIGKYFATGIYPYLPNFTYARPPTVSPPAYGLLLNIVQLFPNPDIMLHALQLLMLAGTGFFMYKTASFFASKSVSLLVACFIILIPGNLLYASLMLTEIGAEFIVSMYLFFIAQFYFRKKSSSLAIASSIGFAMTLWKYVFIIFGIYAFVLFLIQKSKKASSYVIVSIGLFVVLFWVKINYNITGVWGLSDNRAVIWNQIVWTGKTLPREDDPSMIEFRNYVPKTVNIFAGYWSMQQFILPYHNNDWRVVDRILRNVAYAAIQEHPDIYLTTAWKSFWQLHEPGQPYWENMTTFGNPSPDVPQPFCGVLGGSIRFCTPIIKSQNSIFLWSSFVKISNVFYDTVFPFTATYVFLPSFLFLLLRGKKFERTLSVLYLMGIGSIIFLVQPDKRYIIPLYPIMLLILVFSIKKLHDILFSSDTKALTGKWTNGQRNQ